ncbi:MAG: sensor histidine kinase [Pseudomonadales bacterium]
MIRNRGLVAKLGRVLALQVALISLAVAAGIYVTYTIVQDSLINEALENEATHFWSLYEQNPQQALPNTNNMLGYLAVGDEMQGVPEQFRSYGSGFLGRVQVGDAEPILYVSEKDQSRLYLIFASEDVSDLAFFFGIVPLSLALVLIYGLSFLTYRLSHRAISPIVQLADYLEKFPFEKASHSTKDLQQMRSLANAEVDVMIDAIDSFTERLDSFIERERIFTRDASHELRTPIAVFKGSLDLLQRQSERPQEDARALARMRRTVEDMEGLIQTLLLLARGEEVEQPGVRLRLNDLVPELIDQVTPLATDRGIKLVLVESADLWVQAPDRVVQILIINLLRNGINYTPQGQVQVEIKNNAVTVKDTGIGMTSSELNQAFEPFYRSERGRTNGPGHGLGLSIVRRLVHQFEWKISVQSNVGEGTEVTINFG